MCRALAGSVERRTRMAARASFNDLFVWCAAHALADVPRMNIGLSGWNFRAVLRGRCSAGSSSRSRPAAAADRGSALARLEGFCSPDA